MINWLIKQPQEIEIREMSIYCTTVEKELKTKTIHSLSGINESMDDITTKKLEETINQIKGEEFSKINYVRLYNLYNNIN